MQPGATRAHVNIAVGPEKSSAGEYLSLTFHCEVLICIILDSFQFGCSGYEDFTLIYLYVLSL